jgi:NitT/TauT family transport system substrate-binding protein
MTDIHSPRHSPRRRALPSRLAALALAAVVALLGIGGAARAQEAIRVAEVVTGNERALLATMAAAGLDAQHGFKLVTRAFGGEEEARRALLKGDVDIIMTDWLWAARQRAGGADVACVAASLAPAAVMVPRDSQITAIADLVDRRFGIGHDAGNPTWVMMRAAALSASRLNLDLTSRTFGPLPGLASQLRAGAIDALVADAPEAALLARQGYARLIGSDALARSFGVEGQIPTAVWAFRDAGILRRPTSLAAFFKASRAASHLLANDAKAWVPLARLYPGADAATLANLRAAHAAGEVTHWGALDSARLNDLAKRLAQVLGAEIPAPLPPGLLRDDLTF